MASPQKENGFAPIANEILEVIARTPFTAYQQRFLWLIFRETYGRPGNPRHATLTMDEISRRINLPKCKCYVILKSLAGTKTVLVRRSTESVLPIRIELSFQKDYERWGSTKSVLSTKTVPIVGTKTVPALRGKPYIKTREDKTTPRRDYTKRFNGGKGTPIFLEPIRQEPSEIPNLVRAFMQRTVQRRPPREVMVLPEPIRQVLLCFKVTQDCDLKDQAWDRVYFKKLANDAEDLLDVFHGDVELTVRCAAELGAEFRAKDLKFTLATIVKHAAEWRYKHASQSHPAQV